MRIPLSVLVLSGALLVQACSGAGVSLLGAGVASSAGVGIERTLSGTANKTFTASITAVEQATVAALAKMDIELVEEKETEEGRRTFVGSAGNREVDIALEPLTGNVTRMSVTVTERNGIFRDASTATEIIIQTARKIDA